MFIPGASVRGSGGPPIVGRAGVCLQHWFVPLSLRHRAFSGASDPSSSHILTLDSRSAHHIVHAFTLHNAASRLLSTVPITVCYVACAFLLTYSCRSVYVYMLMLDGHATRSQRHFSSHAG